MPIRLIATDMDGTLLNDTDPFIPPENAAALRRAVERGIELVFASGRLHDDAGTFAVQAELPARIIGLNGAVTQDAPYAEPVEALRLNRESVRKIIPVMEASGVEYAVFGMNEVVAANDMSYERARIVIGTHLSRGEGRCAFRNGRAGMDRTLADCVKVVALSSDEGLLRSIANRVMAACPDVEVTSSWCDNIEIMPRGITKGRALTALAVRLGIPMSDVMALGDSDNDISMLSAAGVSVAMGNASDRVKAAAKYVTGRNDAFGLRDAVRALVFGEDVACVRKNHP